MRTHIPEGASLIPKEAHRVFSGIIYDVYNWEQKMFDDSVQTFEMLKRPDTVKIIPVKEGKVVITKQTQPNLKKKGTATIISPFVCPNVRADSLVYRELLLLTSGCGR